MHWRVKDAEETRLVEAARAAFNEAITARDALPREEQGAINRARWKASDDPFGDLSVYDGMTDRYREVMETVHRHYDEMRNAERSYFRLNVWGMSSVMNAMVVMKMAYAAIADDTWNAGWPDVKSYGTTHEAVNAVEEPADYPELYAELTVAQARAANDYITARDERLAFHGGADQTGIPEHKFSSNDGWFVTPSECRDAVSIWRTAVDLDGEPRCQELVLQALGATEKNRDDWWMIWTRWIDYLDGAVSHGGFEVH